VTGPAVMRFMVNCQVMARLSLWLDCDPGHDDVIAIAMASEFADLVGVSTVAGNAPLAATTNNALISAQIFGVDVDVFPGCDRPLVRPPVFAANIHGASGLAGPVLPELARTAKDLHGSLALIEASKRHRGMWLVPTGPLTNIALALRLDPTLTERIAGISLMGGGPTFGNTTPWAEFNIWADPEAASIVFNCGADIVMCGLNVTHEVLFSLADAEAMRSHGTTRAEFVADLLHHFATAYRDVFFDDAQGPLHDPCAVLALTHSELFTVTRRHVDIELGGALTRGMTVVDQRDVKHAPVPNTSVATGVDGPGVKSVISEALNRMVAEQYLSSSRAPTEP
jgi:inosine-uridine nucleoside N-ribohydrolase